MGNKPSAPAREDSAPARLAARRPAVNAAKKAAVPAAPTETAQAVTSPKAASPTASASVSSPRHEDAAKKSDSSPTRPARSESEELMANWKLFHDLENREEADVLELSLFLDALTRYMPGMEDHRNRSSTGESPPPIPTLGKTVSEQVVGKIDIANMYLEASELDEVITLENVKDLIESCKKGMKIPRQTVVRVLNQATRLFQAEANVMHVNIAPANHITIIGDLHGQLDDLLLILRENGLPSESNPYVFNGDIVDRGDRGVEIAVLVYLFKILHPKHVFVNRGNHEDWSITHVFGFKHECELKYDSFVYDLFCESFKWLPLATLLDERVLIVHGGITRDLIALKELEVLERNEYDLTRWRDKPKLRSQREPHRRMQLMRDLLWSDPKSTKGWIDNKRGAGILFGPDVAQKWLTRNRLSLVVRSHECVPRGFDWPYGDKGMVVTLFSASNYCGKANNLGCFMRIPSDRREKPAFFQYMASAESRDMAISNLDGLYSLIVEQKEELLEAFQHADQTNTGKLTLAKWGQVLDDVLDLSLDWASLHPLLTSLDESGLVPYEDFLARYNAEGAVDTESEAESDLDDADRRKRRAAFNSLYRHRTRLETLFRMLDRDGNGTITLDELEAGIKVLNDHLPEGMDSFSTNAMNYMRMLDFTHDNRININEFMEGFRINTKLTTQARWKRARNKIKALSAIGALRTLLRPISEPDEQEREQDGTANSDIDRPVSADDDALDNAPPITPIMMRHASVQMVGFADPDQVQVAVEDGVSDAPATTADTNTSSEHVDTNAASSI